MNSLIFCYPFKNGFDEQKDALYNNLVYFVTYKYGIMPEK